MIASIFFTTNHLKHILASRNRSLPRKLARPEEADRPSSISNLRSTVAKIALALLGFGRINFSETSCPCHRRASNDHRTLGSVDMDKALTEVWMRQFRIAVAFANAEAQLSETFAL